jgi:hypothetical protein
MNFLQIEKASGLLLFYGYFVLNQRIYFLELFLKILFSTIHYYLTTNMIVGVRYFNIFVDEILFYVVFEKDEYERKCVF